jgi:hypothetical protein
MFIGYSTIVCDFVVELGSMHKFILPQCKLMKQNPTRRA